jgi:hypothetical protein
MEYFKNLFGGDKGGLAYTLGNSGNGSYVASNGSNSYTYGNAADAASALDGLNFGIGQTGGVGGGSGEGFGAGLADFLSSDSLKGAGAIAGIGSGIFNIMNSKKALKQAERQWEAENNRANEIMAMNREKYNTYKSDKAKLNSQYVG